MRGEYNGVSGTVESRAGRILTNIFVLVSARMKTEDSHALKKCFCGLEWALKE